MSDEKDALRGFFAINSIIQLFPLIFMTNLLFTMIVHNKIAEWMGRTTQMLTFSLADVDLVSWAWKFVFLEFSAMSVFYMILNNCDYIPVVENLGGFLSNYTSTDILSADVQQWMGLTALFSFIHMIPVALFLMALIPDILLNTLNGPRAGENFTPQTRKIISRSEVQFLVLADVRFVRMENPQKILIFATSASGTTIFIKSKEGDTRTKCYYYTPRTDEFEPLDNEIEVSDLEGLFRHHE